MFILEPPNRLEFINTLGGRADCTARGNPAANIEWLDQDNNPVTTIMKVIKETYACNLISSQSSQTQHTYTHIR